MTTRTCRNELVLKINVSFKITSKSLWDFEQFLDRQLDLKREKKSPSTFSFDIWSQTRPPNRSSRKEKMLNILIYVYSYIFYPTRRKRTYFKWRGINYNQLLFLPRFSFSLLICSGFKKQKVLTKEKGKNIIINLTWGRLRRKEASFILIFSEC